MAKPRYDVVNLIAFNRPAYFDDVCRSIAAQAFDPGAVFHVWIDGYRGSLDETRGAPDRTGDVEAVARARFPEAVIHRFSENLGIAGIYDAAEMNGLERSAGRYVLFFEEDLVLAPRYMEAMHLLMDWADGQDDIAIVTAHGYVHTRLGEARKHIETPPGLYFVGSLWAYAAKRSHMAERRSFLEGYLSLVRGRPYHDRDHAAIQRYYAEQGAGLITFSSQDNAKHAALMIARRCAVTVNPPLGRYIGEQGQHQTPERYRQLGFADVRIADFDPDLWRRLLPESVSYADLVPLRLIELQSIRCNVLESTIRRQRRRAEAAGMRPLAAPPRHIR